MNSKYDLTGKVFGSWTVIRKDCVHKGARNSYWICRCVCGNERSVTRSSLIKGISRSCGCMVYDSMRGINKTHGMSGTRIYHIWLEMRNRCKLQGNRSWKNYGGRGIEVCDEWNNSFQSFYEWANKTGYNDTLSIERVNVNGNYEPSNCTWIKPENQSKNRRNTVRVLYDGKLTSLSELSDLTGIPLRTLHRRYFRYKEKGIEIPTAKLIEPIKANRTAFRYRK